MRVVGASGPDLEAVPVAAFELALGTGAMKRRETTFGPSALVTPANVLTLARLLASPIMVALVIATGPSSWLLVGLWFVCSSSDGLDGVLARRHGDDASGAFLDPLADKFLVLGVLAALAGIGEISWLPVILIAAREISMSVFRGYAGKPRRLGAGPDLGQGEDLVAGSRDRARLLAAGRPAPRQRRRLGALVRRGRHALDRPRVPARLPQAARRRLTRRRATASAITRA